MRHRGREGRDRQCEHEHDQRQRGRVRLARRAAEPEVERQPAAAARDLRDRGERQRVETQRDDPAREAEQHRHGGEVRIESAPVVA